MPETAPDAPAPAARADLEKLTKAELIDRLVATSEDVARLTARVDELRAPQGPRGPRPEDAFLVSALLDLHRAALHASHPDAPRFLAAALKAGGPLAAFILEE
jgi:hypothetical protein